MVLNRSTKVLQHSIPVNSKIPDFKKWQSQINCTNTKQKSQNQDKQVKQKTNTATTTTNRTMFGKIRGKSVKILILLEKQPFRTVDLSEILNYSPRFAWVYLKRLQKYGLTREQDFFWFLTDLGSFFILNFVNKDTILRSIQKVNTKSTPSQHENKIENKQVSLEKYCQIHTLDDSTREVAVVLVDNYRATNQPGRIFSDYYEAIEWFNEKSKSGKELTQIELGDALIRLCNEGVCWQPNLMVGGRPKIGLKKEFIQKLKIEHDIS